MQALSLQKLVLSAQQMAQKEHFAGSWESLVDMFDKRLQLYKYNRVSLITECKPTIGIEFYPAIKNEKDLLNHIMRLHLYLPQVFFNQAQFYEFSTALDDRNIFDRRNVGSLLGMAFMGIVGFLALGFTIMGMIAGGVLGVMLGRYAGRRMKKTFTSQKVLLEFDIYSIRLRCYIKWAEERGKTYRYNVNFIRFIAEKLLLETKTALHYKQFNADQQKQAKKIILKVAEIFKEKYFIHALILSLKMSHEYLRILRLLSENSELNRGDIEEFQHFKNFRAELEVCLMKAIDNVLRPLVRLLEDSNPKSKVLKKIRDQAKSFLIQKDVIQLTKQYPDPQMRITYIKMLAEKMKQSIKNDSIISYLKKQHFRDIEQIGIVIDQQIDQQQIEQKQVGDIKQIELEIIQEENEQNLTPKQQLKSQYSAGSESEFQPLQEDCPKSSQKLQELQLKITQHPNQVFIDSNQGDQIIQNSLAQSLSQADIKQILEPEQQVSLQHRQSVEINQQIVQYSEETTKKFELFLKFYEESTDSWECVTTKDDIYIYKSMKPGCGSVFLKGHSFIYSHDKQVVFNAVYQKEFRTKWDKIMQKFNIVRHEREDIDIMYYVVVPPIPIVSTREWLQRRVLRYDFPYKGQICLLFYSVDLQEFPITKNPVRAHTEIAGYVFENTSSGTKITFVSNNDIKGSIPKLLVNHASAKGPFGWFGNLRKACDLYRKHNGDLSRIVIS
ncbi:unnamed protein product [Paramecium primaurelia]|uniref:Phosphatidylcholine transfer protein n=1 Tax=Paramecium primaurelia TaxID=5886 RepID=A0A8S1QET3_PARPR|nr:unnamed protein product [Paramecium primaurelia]